MRDKWHSPLKQVEVAQLLGVAPQTVGRWGNNPPGYAIAVVGLYNDVENLKQKVKDFAQSI